MKTKFIKYIFLLMVLILVLSTSCSENVNTGNDIIIYEISPNPFHNYGNLSISISQPVPVTIIFTDIYGREVLKLFDNRFFDAGIHEIRINFENQPAGVYCCIIKVSGELFITKFSKYWYYFNNNLSLIYFVLLSIYL